MEHAENRPRRLTTLTPVVGRSARVTSGLAGVAVAAVIGVACGGSGDSSGVTTVLITATTYATVPLRSTTTTQPPAPTVDRSASQSGGQADQPAPDRSVESAYVIKRGDYLVGIARDFGMAYQVLIEYNGWSDGPGHELVPGDTIRIPPAGYDPTAADAAAGSAPEGSAAGPAGGPTCPDGSAQDTYRIRAGDVKFRVAQGLGTTVDELDAVNAATPHYRAFVVGIDILVPC